MMKKIVALLLAIVLAVSLCSCKKDTAADDGRLSVTVTFDALYELVQAVGGDRVNITKIVPDGVEPHDFEPKASDLVALGSAAVFVVNGLGMDSWAQQAADASKNDNLIFVTAAEDTDVITTDDGVDMHVWLSLREAATMTKTIASALASADPDNAEYYEANCEEFCNALDEMYFRYSAAFETAPSNDFVTDHAAFGYLCRDFGLEQLSVRSMYADGEPSARQLGELIDYCIENGITTIFAEELAGSEISDTLANDAGAEVKTIYTLESAEDGKTYLERMEDNLSIILGSLG